MKSIYSYLRQLVLKKLEKPRRSYEHRVYNNIDKLYAVIKPGDQTANIRSRPALVAATITRSFVRG